MACGLPPQECATVHLAPRLDLRPTKQDVQWAGPCPACHGLKCFSLTVAGSRKLFHCNRRPECSQDAILAAIAAVLPECVPGTRKAPTRPAPRRVVDPDELIALALDRRVPGNALRLRLLQMAGMGTEDAVTKLGLARSTRKDALRILGQNPRR